MYTLYGIPNCDVVKKTTTWLNKHQVQFNFHDYKKEGISAKKLQAWFKQVGWQTVLNKKSTVWKELGEAVQATVVDEATAITLLQQHTSIIKRPVIEQGGRVVAVGFKEADYGPIFLSK